MKHNIYSIKQIIHNRIKACFKKVKGQSRIDIYDDDIFLCSYPRSGNTWIRYILAYYRNPNFEWDLQTIEQIVPDLHRTVRVSDIPRPRIMKSHSLYDPLFPKVIYLVRDGRDVCVSYYDVYKKIHGYQGTLDDFVIELCEEKIPPSSWHKHVLSWIKNKNTYNNIHLIRYEDLHSQPLKTITSIIEFIGLEVSMGKIENALNKASVEKIWGDHKRVGPHKNLGFRGGVSGQAGNWSKWFSEQTERNFLSYAYEPMKILGYK